MVEGSAFSLSFTYLLRMITTVLSMKDGYFGERGVTKEERRIMREGKDWTLDGDLGAFCRFCGVQKIPWHFAEISS